MLAGTANGVLFAGALMLTNGGPFVDSSAWKALKSKSKLRSELVAFAW
ncbi:MAG TPA: hypothetical protein VK846_13580 [Candidatus Limnocylindria bacterium]|nr:hypothetical protein [Candidatus Limnocylindria bacterium]